jgi:hypothetical protein
MLVATKHQVITILTREPWWAEFWSALAAIGWALVAFSANDVLNERAAFIQLAYMASPIFWEMSGFALGTIQLFALIFANAYGRVCASFFCTWWWTFITLSILLHDPRAPSIALYIVFAAINVFSMLKISARRYA